MKVPVKFSPCLSREILAMTCKSWRDLPDGDMECFVRNNDGSPLSFATENECMTWLFGNAHLFKFTIDSGYSKPEGYVTPSLIKYNASPCPACGCYEYKQSSIRKEKVCANCETGREQGVLQK